MLNFCSLSYSKDEPHAQQQYKQYFAFCEFLHYFALQKGKENEKNYAFKMRVFISDSRDNGWNAQGLLC